MQSGIKSTILAISVTSMFLILVVGQVAPPALAQTTTAMDNLIKRDFSFGGNQHLTASSGNTIVCGDHICAPGEWTMLQDNLNHDQIVRSANSTNAMSTNSTMTVSTNSMIQMSGNSTMKMSNSTSPIPPPYPMPPTPTPLPTPPSISPVVCSKVKTDLANSTISLGMTAKILSDLGCVI